MKNYKNFEKVYIGDSDMAELVVRAPGEVSLLKFGKDSSYKAYECFGDVIIGEHYKKVFSGKIWLMIYDDDELTYKKYKPEGYEFYDIYRAGEHGCVIHWH